MYKYPSIMYRYSSFVIALLFFTINSYQLAYSVESKPSPSWEWKLVWSDEFNGTTIDSKKWDFDIGNGFYNYDTNTWINGWGNNELQYYTRESENAFVKNGLLHIRALKESLFQCGYSSARLKTRNRYAAPLFNKKYGRFEIKAKLPSGKGIWPAIWMLPQNNMYGAWPASGEIDIAESHSIEPNTIIGSLHFGSKFPAVTSVNKKYTFPENQNIADFHVYALEWEPTEIRWYVDGTLYSTQLSWWSGTAPAPATTAPLETAKTIGVPPFDQPFYLIMNVAVEGRAPNLPDQSTLFPAEMLVDYVRVYEKAPIQAAPPVQTKTVLLKKPESKNSVSNKTTIATP